MAFEHHDPDSGGAAQQYRMLVQAKVARPGKSLLGCKRERRQYDGLVAAAKISGAAPYYALYVQQPDAHSSSPTVCRRHVSAADRSIILVAAGIPWNDLRGQSVEQVLLAGRPLRCLGGCTCTGGSSPPDSYSAVRAFVRASVPEQEPAASNMPMPRAAPRLVMNAARYRPGRDGADEGDPRTPPAGTEGTLLVVRLGRQAPSPDRGRAHIGYDLSMTADELRNAARMYWRLDTRRARVLRHLVAASGTMPLEAYDIVPDSLTYTVGATVSAGQRSNFGKLRTRRCERSPSPGKASLGEAPAGRSEPRSVRRH